MRYNSRENFLYLPFLSSRLRLTDPVFLSKDDKLHDTCLHSHWEGPIGTVFLGEAKFIFKILIRSKSCLNTCSTQWTPQMWKSLASTLPKSGKSSPGPRGPPYSAILEASLLQHSWLKRPNYLLSMSRFCTGLLISRHWILLCWTREIDKICKTQGPEDWF